MQRKRSALATPTQSHDAADSMSASGPQDLLGNAEMQERMRGEQGAAVDFGTAVRQGRPIRVSEISAFAKLLGQDLSNVRTVQDQSGFLEANNASAAMSGDTLLFAQARPAPEDIAHELIHVAQGAGGARRRHRPHCAGRRGGGAGGGRPHTGSALGGERPGRRPRGIGGAPQHRPWSARHAYHADDLDHLRFGSAGQD